MHAINGLNGTNLGGRAINVNEARPKTDSPRRRWWRRRTARAPLVGTPFRSNDDYGPMIKVL